MATLNVRANTFLATTNTTWSNTGNSVDGLYGVLSGTVSVWTNTTANAVGTIEVGFGTLISSVIGASDTINSVTVTLRQLRSNTARVPTVTFQPFDGATAIGSASTATASTSLVSDVVVFPATLAQVRSSTFKVRVTATRFNGTQAGTFSIDWVDISIDYTPVPPTVTQASYRFYADGNQAGSTALAAQDTAYTADVSQGDVVLHVRARLQLTTAIAPQPSDDWQLQVEKNASGTWTSMTVGSPAVPYAAANLTDAGATTNRLGAGTGSFVAGKVSEDGLVDDLTWSGSNYTEVLYSVVVKESAVANGDTLRFRVLYNGATTQMTYTQTPTVNITKGGAPQPAMSTLTETFDASLGSQFAAWGGSTVWDASGRAKCTALSPTGYSGLSSIGRYLFDSVFVRVTPPVAKASRETVIVVAAPNGDGATIGIIGNVGAQQVLCRRTENGTQTTVANPSYSATNHAWLRIRLVGTTLYFDGSTNGTTWNNLTSTTTSSSLIYTSLDVNCGQYANEGSVDSAYFDNINAVVGGLIKVWSGSAWVGKPLKVWNGSAWVAKPVKVWTGSTWKPSA